MGSRILKLIMGISFLCLGAVLPGSRALAEDLPLSGPADYYQSALQAYLAGDLDHAVLLDSKALQADPRDKKAMALLSILISEQDAAKKTVIWIGGKPSVMDDHPTSAAPTTIIKEVRLRPRTQAVDAQKLAELESRIQTVAFLMQRDAFNQYRELNGNQAQMAKELAGISQSLKDAGFGFQYANVLFLLVLFVAFLALWNSWKARRDLEKQVRLQNPPGEGDEKEKVIRFHRR